MSRSYRFLVGVGGIGSGMFFALRGDHTLGRNESRSGTILRRRDFCKLHIVCHYVAALTGAGFTVVPIGRVGRDAAGSELIEHMRRAGMCTRFVTADPKAPTLFSVCFVYPDGDGGNMTAQDSASAKTTPADVERAVSALPEVLGPPDAECPGVALAVPEAPLSARMRLLELAGDRGWYAAAGVTTGEVEAARRQGMFARVDLLGVNRDEAAAIAGVDPAEPIEAIVHAAGPRLAEANPAIRLCVTAGAAGSYGWEAGSVEHTPAPPVQAANTAGAGDATLAGLIVAGLAGAPFIRPDRARRTRLADAPLETAVDFAALLAGLTVTSEDTINFDADARALGEFAARLGLDASPLGPLLAPS